MAREPWSLWKAALAAALGASLPAPSIRADELRAALAQADAAASRTSGKTNDLVFDNDGRVNDAPAPVAARGRVAAASRPGAQAPAPAGLAATVPVPVPDQRTPQASPSAQTQALMLQVGFGAAAGVVIGIGLVPLLGPLGILAGAVLFAAISVAVIQFGGNS